jgi:predicted GH43/DUF377 family glycosyl hydrolase
MITNLKIYDPGIMPDVKKVVAMFCDYGDRERKKRIIAKITGLSEDLVRKMLHQIHHDFDARHYKFEAILKNNFDRILKIFPELGSFTPDRRQLTGAFFSNEYAYAAAAFMNPSLVPAGATERGTSLIMSIRAVGEGHISSIAFRELAVQNDHQVAPVERSRYSVLPTVLNQSSDSAEIRFDSGTEISERVIYPVGSDESNGMEDARFVAFEDGRYFATYTAYDGKNIRVKLLETVDFETFVLHRIDGEGIRNKGLALFPEMIKGKYAMIGRLDGENMFYLETDNLMRWDSFKAIGLPFEPWELIQIGNCGSPLAAGDGWLLITHGVGPMRSYYIGAYLLDRDKPWHIRSRLPEPLISPFDNPRDGYVPNVVYSCGGAIVDEILYLPFGVADYFVRIASVPVKDILNAMKPI